MYETKASFSTAINSFLRKSFPRKYSDKDSQKFSLNLSSVRRVLLLVTAYLLHKGY